MYLPVFVRYCAIEMFAITSISIICPTLHNHAICDFTTMVPPGYGYASVGYTASTSSFFFFASDSSVTMM